MRKGLNQFWAFIFKHVDNDGKVTLGELLSKEELPMSVSSDQIAVRQSQVDKLYAGLKDLAQERRSKLEEVLKLYMLSHEIEDLMQWIAEREVVACSHELGQDFEHVTVSIIFKL